MKSSLSLAAGSGGGDDDDNDEGIPLNNRGIVARSLDADVKRWWSAAVEATVAGEDGLM